MTTVPLLPPSPSPTRGRAEAVVTAYESRLVRAGEPGR